MERKYQDIPSVIKALHMNKVDWDILLELSAGNKEGRYNETLQNKLNLCSKERDKLVKELKSWFK